MFEMRFVDPMFAKTYESRRGNPFLRSNCIFNDSECAISLCPVIHYLNENTISFCTLTHANGSVSTDVVVEQKKAELQIKKLCETCKFKSK